MRRRLSARLFPVVVSFLPAVAFAQSPPARIEAGGTVASACIGSDGSTCRGSHAMSGVYFSVWPWPGVELGGRVASLDRPAGRRRVFAAGYAYGHYGRDPRTRLFFGLSVGRFWDRRPTGTWDRSIADVAPVAGVSGVAGPVSWRTGIQIHNLFSGSSSTPELFAGAGWRF